MYALQGGNIGLQIGGEATDFVLLVINDRGVDSLLHTIVRLGAGQAEGAHSFGGYRRLYALGDSGLFPGSRCVRGRFARRFDTATRQRP
jgi:hypothetical protein